MAWDASSNWMLDAFYFWLAAESSFCWFTVAVLPGLHSFTQILGAYSQWHFPQTADLETVMSLLQTLACPNPWQGLISYIRRICPLLRFWLRRTVSGNGVQLTWQAWCDIVHEAIFNEMGLCSFSVPVTTWNLEKETFVSLVHIKTGRTANCTVCFCQQCNRSWQGYLKKIHQMDGFQNFLAPFPSHLSYKSIVHETMNFLLSMENIFVPIGFA